MALDKDGNVIPAFRPDNPDMYGGGRMTNFIATFKRVYLEPRRGKENPKHFLFGCIDLTDIVMKDGSEHDDMTRRWFAGYLSSQFGQGTFPSNDGVTPAGGTEDDYKALADGTAQITEGDEENYRGVLTCGNKVSLTAEWTQLLNSVMKAPVDGTDGEVWKGWGSDASSLNGLRVELISVPREGGKKGKEDQETLVVARIVSGPGVAGAPAVAATTATKPAAGAKAAPASTPAAVSTNGNSALDDELANDVYLALLDAPGNTLAVHPGLTGLAMKKYATEPAKMKTMVPRVALPAFHQGRPWSFDAVKKTISLATG